MDIGKSKAEALAKRLLKINPKANIKFHEAFIDHENVLEFFDGVKIAINALDFKSDIPFEFDAICSQRKIPVLHPFNFGWGAFLTILTPGGYQLREVSDTYDGFEVKMAEFVARFSTFWNLPNSWLGDVIDAYKMRAGCKSYSSVGCRIMDCCRSLR